MPHIVAHKMSRLLLFTFSELCYRYSVLKFLFRIVYYNSSDTTRYTSLKVVRSYSSETIFSQKPLHISQVLSLFVKTVLLVKDVLKVFK